MGTAVKAVQLEEPTMAEVKHLTFTGDLTDSDKTVVSVSLEVKDNFGNVYTDMGVIVEDIPNMNGFLNSFANSVLPKIVAKVEVDLGVAFE